MKKVWHAATESPYSTSYTHLRGYHAGRPTDVGDYLTFGIQLFNQENMRQKAASLFGKTLPEIKDLEDERNFSSSKEIYFCISTSELINNSGHYLCWGSEYFAGLASSLDRNIFGQHHRKLEETGIPTIFICDVPIELIPMYLLDDLAGYNVRHHCSFWIRESLSADCIVGHEHPKQFFNPVQNRRYINHQTECRYC